MTRMLSHRTLLASIPVTLALACVSAYAAPVAYVASEGNDARARCTLAAPCRTFQAAHDVVDPGGQVVAIDTADYGVLNVTKSLSVVGSPGTVAGITVLSGVGVTIASAGVDVVLKNLHVTGAGGAGGVRMTAGRSLTVEGCVVAGFSGDGIRIDAGQAASIVDTVVRGNGGHGAYLGSGHAQVAQSRFMANGGSGLYLEAGTLGVSATVSDSVASHNGDRGFSSKATGNSSRMSLVRATASRNAGAGIANELVSPFADAKMTITSSTATLNRTGIFNTVGGLITNSLVYSSGDNVVMFNQLDIDGIVAAVPVH